MWERFSFYGMRALLVLFLIRAWSWRPEDALSLYGTYTALVYLAPLAGGYLADRWMGTRRAMTLGGALITCGHASLAFGGNLGFYTGLACVIAGTGLFKPNVSTMVGQLYQPGDHRRDGGFTFFYMGINLGAFLSPLVCGYLGERLGWEWGFAAAGVGMVLGLGLYLLRGEQVLGPIGKSPAGGGSAGSHPPLTAEERGRLLGLLVLFLFVTIFWAGYEQAGSTMNLFADQHTDRLVHGFEIPTSWFQSVSPLGILIFGPMFAALWRRLADRGMDPPTAFKMAAGLLLLALGFQVLALGGARADSGALVSPWWLVLSFTLHVWGELCLSPVGLSFVTRTAPARYGGVVMAAWFLANSIGNKLAGVLASRGTALPRGSYYAALLVISLVGAVGLLLLAPRLTRLTRTPSRAEAEGPATP
jgi:POT family proton-dependent oligopeptide transporter